MGRFLSEDPVFGDLKRPSSLHAFGYADGNPLTYTDENGEAINVPLAGIGAAIGGVVGCVMGAWNAEDGQGWSACGKGALVGSVGGAAGSAVAPAAGGAVFNQTGSTLAGKVAGGVTAAVTGDVAGQGTAIATGMQDQFDPKQLAVSTVLGLGGALLPDGVVTPKKQAAAGPAGPM